MSAILCVVVGGYVRATQNELYINYQLDAPIIIYL